VILALLPPFCSETKPSGDLIAIYTAVWVTLVVDNLFARDCAVNVLFF